MKEYKTIKDCAVDIICTDGDKLSNKEIAEQVRSIMENSATTDKCIAWYKNKINRGIIEVDSKKCAWFKRKDIERYKETESLDIEEEIISNEAERYVYEMEKVRTGKYPIKMNNNGPGYDFDSGDRHIEVKGVKKKNKNHLQLTANETTALIQDPKYFLYLVEGDFNKNEDIDVYMIPKNDLLEMAQMKIHARLTRLKNKESRIKWRKHNINRVAGGF
jgi:hypothetical protein